MKMRITLNLSVAARAGIVLTAACATACGGGAAGAGETFIAFQRDFATFRTWEQFDAGVGGEPGDLHAEGVRTAFLNRRPGAAPAAFPVGTIVVKTQQLPDGGPGQTFAMVKRGGDYNAEGARGWEYFELKEGASEPAIVWRGVTPPRGEGYSGAAGGACNECHVRASGNDFVQTPALRLSRF